MALSVIIITLNEEQYLGNLLEDLSRQQAEIGEVIISDGGSSDKTEAVASSFKAKLPIRFVTAPKRGWAAQKNFAVGLAKYPALLFLDADVRLSAGLVANLSQRLTQEKHRMVVPRITADTHRLLFRAGAWMTYFYFRLLCLIGGQAASYQCFMIAKADYLAIGGVDETLLHAEDIDFIKRAGRAGVKLVWVPQATAAASIRRFEQVGTWRLFGRYIRSEIHRHLHGGKVSKDYVGYTENHFQTKR